MAGKKKKGGSKKIEGELTLEDLEKAAGGTVRATTGTTGPKPMLNGMPSDHYILTTTGGSDGGRQP